MTRETRRCPNRTPARRDAAVPPLDYFYMPAMPPLWLGEALSRWLRAWRQRRAHRELAGLGEHLQRDVGIKREDAR